MTNTTNSMVGAGGIRPIVARWSFTATICSISPIHLGSGEHGDTIDLLLLRDRVSGRPLLTGASLAGGLRDYLCDEHLGSETVEPRPNQDPNDNTAKGIAQDGKASPEACAELEKVAKAAKAIAQLFGGVREDPTGGQSALIVFDAKGEAVPEVRDGVRITPEGVAAEHFKFSYEIWPRGTSFPIQLDLVVGNSDLEAEAIALLVQALGGLDGGHIRVGAKGRRGFGRCELADVRAVRYDLTTEAGWRTWLKTGLHNAPIAAVRPCCTPLEAVRQAWSERADEVAQRVDAAARATRARRFSVRVPIAFKGGVQIGVPQTTAGGADTTHLTSAGVPVLSGTALAGPLRNRARRVARVVHSDESRGMKLVDELLGTEPRPGGDEQPLRASRLVVEEVPIQGGTALQTTRIQLDHLTQAPVPGMLVQEEPWFGGRAELVFTLRLPDSADLAKALKGFLLLLVKDLVLGDVPVGGTTGIGRGAVRPVGALEVFDNDGPCAIALDRDPQPALRAKVEGWIQAFRTFRGVA